MCLGERLFIEKTKIIKIAINIDTYELSKGPEVCDALGPKHPATHSSVEEIKAEEEKLFV